MTRKMTECAENGLPTRIFEPEISSIDYLDAPHIQDGIGILACIQSHLEPDREVKQISEQLYEVIHGVILHMWTNESFSWRNREVSNDVK
jgi:hypothetical protein